MNRINKNQIQNFFSGITDDIAVFEKGIPLSVQKEYLNLSQKRTKQNIAKMTLQKANALLDQQTPTQVKKRLLIELAHLGTIESYRTIERFFKQADQQLKT